MADSLPIWAIEEAHKRLKVEAGLSPTFETYSRGSVPVRALARVIAAHEEPPVDSLLKPVGDALASAGIFKTTDWNESARLFLSELPGKGLKIVEAE